MGCCLEDVTITALALRNVDCGTAVIDVVVPPGSILSFPLLATAAPPLPAGASAPSASGPVPPAVLDVGPVRAPPSVSNPPSSEGGLDGGVSPPSSVSVSVGDKVLVDLALELDSDSGGFVFSSVVVATAAHVVTQGSGSGSGAGSVAVVGSSSTPVSARGHLGKAKLAFLEVEPPSLDSTSVEGDISGDAVDNGVNGGNDAAILSVNNGGGDSSNKLNGESSNDDGVSDLNGAEGNGIGEILDGATGLNGAGIIELSLKLGNITSLNTITGIGGNGGLHPVPHAVLVGLSRVHLLDGEGGLALLVLDDLQDVGIGVDVPGLGDRLVRDGNGPGGGAEVRSVSAFDLEVVDESNNDSDKGGGNGDNLGDVHVSLVVRWLE